MRLLLFCYCYWLFFIFSIKATMMVDGMLEIGRARCIISNYCIVKDQQHNSCSCRKIQRFNSLCITWWFSDIYANWTRDCYYFFVSLRFLLLFYRWKVYTQCKLYICTHLDKMKLFYYYRLPIIYGWSFVFPHSNVSFKHFVIFLLLFFICGEVDFVPLLISYSFQLHWMLLWYGFNK